jgi:hypothetical protein
LRCPGGRRGKAAGGWQEHFWEQNGNIRLQRLIARLRNRVQTSFKEITDQMELARHGAHTFEGLLTRTVAVLAAHTLLLTELGNAM